MGGTAHHAPNGLAPKLSHATLAQQVYEHRREAILANAIHEEMLYDPNTGQILNGTLFDYHVPTIEDLPGALVSTIVENGDGPGPYGAKGVGDGSLAGATAAVVTALGDLGIRVTVLPASRSGSGGG